MNDSTLSWFIIPIIALLNSLITALFILSQTKKKKEADKRVRAKSPRIPATLQSAEHDPNEGSTYFDVTLRLPNGTVVRSSTYSNNAPQPGQTINVVYNPIYDSYECVD